MVAAAYGARVSPKPARPSVAEAPRKSWFARFMDALIEARMQQAHREIARHAQLLPYSLDERGNRLVKTDSEMPFGGW